MAENDHLPSYGAEGSVLAPEQSHGRGGTFTHGGKFLRYDVYGHVFDVTAKYHPPIQPINTGAYGVVCSAWNVETNERVAIKKIPSAFEKKIIANRILREIMILRHMKHDNILALREIIPPPKWESFNDVYIVTELMDTDLQRIIEVSQDITEEQNQFFLYQLLRGLKYIHSANVLHRDLKPGNLLVNENCNLKIADFGLARMFSETDMMTEYVVTRWYRPPELLLNARRYNAAVDMWSVGCILMELFNQKPLFQGKTYAHQFRSIIELMGSPTDSDLSYVTSDHVWKYIRQFPKHPKQPLAEKFPHVPALVLDLVEKMLMYDPTKRITADEALGHPYLSKWHDLSDEPSCPTPFNLNLDEQSLTEEDIKRLIYQQTHN